MNGQREDNNNYLIEGITATDANVAELTNTPLPSPDAVAEFRAQTSLYDATQGRNGGGNVGRNTYRGPFQQNWDFSLRKNFAQLEKAHFEFTTDFFNLFNHPIFSSPWFVDVERASNFGQITSIQGSSRLVQFSGRLSF